MMMCFLSSGSLRTDVDVLAVPIKTAKSDTTGTMALLFSVSNDVTYMSHILKLGQNTMQHQWSRRGKGETHLVTLLM